MESAPLTAAHSHARSATLELSKANTTAASNEHELAAGEFSKAAAGTDDAEALRILALLEEYHHALAKSIQAEPRPSTNTKAHYDPSTGLTLTTASGSPSGESKSIPQSSPQARSSPSRASGRQRPRDLSSSIASNLASARGIPGGQRPQGAPISSTVTAHTAVASASSQARQKNLELSPSSAVEAARKQLWQGEESIIPRPIVSRSSQGEKHVNEEQQSPSTHSDTAFHRFYSNFEGYFSTLTAPLVFAGFPLNPSSNSPATSPQPVQQSPKPSLSSPTNQNAPDLNNIFSRSALRALKDKNGLSAAAESFYVVPTSGGTVSYAQMVNHTKHPHEPRTSASADGDEFVDASETPYPTSPMRSKHSARTSPSASRHTPAAGGKVRRGKTHEELELETQQQRDIIDNLSKRLVQFETHSQSQRLALAQSMHSHRSPSRTGEGQDTASDIPPVPPLPKIETPASGPPEQQKQTTDPQMDELQASLLALQRENAKLARENERRGNVITQYREKWEELKTAARRKAKQREANAASTVEPTNDVEGQKSGL